jgi:hypothetical protein
VWRSRLSDGHAIQCNAKQTCSGVFYLVWRSRLSDGHAIQCKANQTCSNVFYAHKLAWQHEVAAQHDPVHVGSASWTLYDRRKKCRLRYSAAGRFICPSVDMEGRRQARRVLQSEPARRRAQAAWAAAGARQP